MKRLIMAVATIVVTAGLVASSNAPAQSTDGQFRQRAARRPRRGWDGA